MLLKWEKDLNMPTLNTLLDQSDIILKNQQIDGKKTFFKLEMRKRKNSRRNRRGSQQRISCKQFKFRGFDRYWTSRHAFNNSEEKNSHSKPPETY